MISNLPTAEKLKTQKGGLALAIEGFLFIKNRDLAGTCVYFECPNESCQANCTFDCAKSQLTKYSGNHNHEPPTTRSHQMRFMNEIKTKLQANLTQKPLRVYGEVLGSQISIYIMIIF